MKTEASNKQPAVSVVMSVYNTEQFVGAAIESVLAQTCADFELICFNDASTDRSLDILRRYEAQDPRIRIINSTINIKQGGGRNRAIRAARGRYLMFLDSDDLLEPQAIELCLAAASEADSEAVFFDYCRYESTSGKCTPVAGLGADASSLRGDDLRRRILERTTSHVTAMYARNVIVDNDLFFPEGLFYEDNANTFAIQTIARNPIKINACLYRYRVNESSVTHSSNNERFFDRLATAEMMLAHMKRLRLYDRFPQLVEFRFVMLYYVHTLFGCIYRFDRVPIHRISQIRDGISRLAPNFRSNPYWRALPVSMKLKVALHARLPRLIKALSRLRRLLSK